MSNLVIHIGQQKTASTTLQRHLHSMRDLLERQGVRYCSAFGRGKARFAQPFFRNKITGGNRQRMLNEFRRELEGPWHTVILSEENLFRLPEDAIRRFREVCSGVTGRIDIYAYIRRPVEHFPSHYQQKVQGFHADSSDEFLEHLIARGDYNVFAQLEKWREAFGEGTVHAKLFDRRTMAAIPALDFLSWAGLGHLETAPPPLEEANPSIDAVSTEALRYAVKFFMQRPEAFSKEQVYAFRDAITACSSTKKLEIAAHQARRLDSAVREDMERLARAYFTKQESELLLRPVSADEVPPPSIDEVIQRTAEVLAPGVDVSAKVKAASSEGVTATASEEQRYSQFAAFLQDLLGSMPEPFGSHRRIRDQQEAKLEKRRRKRVG